MNIDLMRPSGGWAVQGIGPTRSDGVNSYVIPAPQIVLDGVLTKRLHLQVEVQFWSSRADVPVEVLLDGRQLDVSTVPRNQFVTLRSAAWVEPGAHTVTIRQTGAERLYWPKLTLSELPAARSFPSWRGVRWELLADPGVIGGRTAVRVGDDGGVSATLTDRAWQVPLPDGTPQQLTVYTGSNAGSYQLEVTAIGTGVLAVQRTPVLTGGGLPSTTETNLDLPRGTNRLEVRALCTAPCDPVMVRGDVLGAEVPVPQLAVQVGAGVVVGVLLLLLWRGLKL